MGERAQQPAEDGYQAASEIAAMHRPVRRDKNLRIVSGTSTKNLRCETCRAPVNAEGCATYRAAQRVLAAWRSERAVSPDGPGEVTPISRVCPNRP